MRYLPPTAVALALASAAALGVASSAKAEQPFKWTGFYIGINGGGAFQGVDFSGFVPAASNMNNAARALEAAIDNGKGSPDSFAYGAQAGFNWQFGNLVFGIEADYDKIAGKNSFDSGLITVGGFTGRTVDDISDQWLATARARLGIAVSPSALLYATGGVAWTHQKFSHTQTWNFGDGCPSAGGGQQTCHVGSSSDTRTTWTAGAGFEVALASKWTLKGEYLYVPGDTITFRTFNVGIGASQFVDQTAKLGHMDILRAGLNYKF